MSTITSFCFFMIVLSRGALVYEETFNGIADGPAHLNIPANRGAGGCLFTSGAKRMCDVAGAFHPVVNSPDSRTNNIATTPTGDKVLVMKAADAFFQTPNPVMISSISRVEVEWAPSTTFSQTPSELDVRVQFPPDTMGSEIIMEKNESPSFSFQNRPCEVDASLNLVPANCALNKAVWNVPANLQNQDDFFLLLRGEINGAPQNGDFIIVSSIRVFGTMQGSGGGDVHYGTTDGVFYTFNGAGDYIYMRSPQMEIHTRAASIPKLGYSTVLSALAIQDKKNLQVLEIWWDGFHAEEVHLNTRYSSENSTQKVVDMSRDLFHVSNFKIFNEMTENRLIIGHKFYDEFELFVNYGGRSSFSLKLPKKWKTQGLGGNNNGVKEDDLCDRFGLCLSLKDVTTRSVHENFAMSWKVKPSELLFQKWMPVEKEELQYHDISFTSDQLLEARKFCENIVTCVYDLLQTGSKDFALHTKNDFLRIARANKDIVQIEDQFL